MKIKQIIQVIILAVLLLLFLISTDPNQISLGLILVPYLLGAIIIYKLLSLVLKALLPKLTKSKLGLYSLILTALITNLALLKSIGQLTLQDGLITGAIIIVSIVYINKFSLDS